MSRRVWAGIGLLATGVGGLVASLSLGSRPPTYAAGPVPSCGDITDETDGGAEAVATAGPFKDDVLLAGEATETGSLLWVRSAARLGRNDLGVNAHRVRRLVDSVRQRLSQG